MAAQIARVLDGALRQVDGTDQEAIRVGTPAWWRWLEAETTRSFAFHGPSGHFTARKASRRGTTYWTAYRKVAGQLFSIYLGKSPALSAERLENVAAQLNERAVHSERGRRPPAPLTNVPPVGAGPAVLATKLYQPRPRPGLVPRTHLLDRLAASEPAITLLSAPAGFGKSTLLSLWLARLSRPVAWLTLDQADNDLGRWLRSLLAALQSVAPPLGASVMHLLDTARPPAAFLVTTLVNDLVALDGPLTLVLDDYQTITSAAVHDALTALLDRRPAQLHMMIASREDPPLPLSRWRAAGALTELRAAELRFTTAEVAAFFTNGIGVALADADVAALETRTEGWAAALQLVALAIQARPEHDEIIAALSGTHRFIVDYLTDEVLKGLPEHLQTFLLQTAILDRLCAPLCDAVLGLEARDLRLEQADAQQAASRGALWAPQASEAYSQLVLDELERKNLFLLPLDGQRQWYRYHQLFRDVLRQRLALGVRPEALAQLHRRACAWYAQHDAPSQAAAHALAAQDWVAAADLIERHGVPLVVRGQPQLVLGWIEALPEPTLNERPVLKVIQAYILLLSNQPAAAEQRLREAEAAQRTRPADARDTRTDGYIAMVWVAILRSVGDLEGAFAQAQRALTLLPASDIFATTAAVVTMHAFWENGDVTPAAEQQVVDALARAQMTTNLTSIVYATSGLARGRMLQGRLYAAVDTYRQVLQLVPEAVLEHLFGGISYFVGLGDVLCEQNDLDTAEPLLMRGVELSRGELLVYPTLLLQGSCALARLRQAQGDRAGATALLAELMQRARQRGLVPAMIARSAAAQAELALAQGDRAAALRWASETGVTLADAGQYSHETEQLTLARVWIAQGRDQRAGPELRDALALLAPLRASAEQQGRVDSLITIDILRALALAAQGHTPAALEALEGALQAGAPEGYVRRFLDEGAPLAALLQEIQSSTAAPDYVARLLAAFPRTAGQGLRTEAAASPHSVLSPQSSALVEPLSGRELEVLGLLAAGRGTSAIAQELIISEGTVKRHISNIMGKLDVHSRIEAVARARSLGLVA
jgi:LuxR family maltose regulon positive regulatory protein